MLYFAGRRRRFRRIAFVMLCVWVLALSAGVANACILLGAGSGVATSAIVWPVSPPSSGETDHAGHGNPAPSSGQASCLKFCADETTAVVSAKTLQSDLPPLAIEHGLRALPGVPAARIEPCRHAEVPERPGPSRVILLLRLTT